MDLLEEGKNCPEVLKVLYEDLGENDNIVDKSLGKGEWLEELVYLLLDI